METKENCELCSQKAYQIDKKTQVIETLTKKNIVLTECLGTMEEHFKSAEATRETMQQMTEAQVEKIKSTMLHQTVREMATKSLHKGRGAEHLVYAISTLGAYLQLKFDSVNQWRKCVFPRETVRRMELRKTGQAMPELSDHQIQHLRKEQLFLLSENQNLMGIVSELQIQISTGIRPQKQHDGFTMDGAVDIDSISYSLDIWSKTIGYRNKVNQRFAFSQLKLNSSMCADVEKGILEPLNSKEGAASNALDVSSSIRSDSMDKRSLAFKYYQQRAAVHLFTSMHSRRVTALTTAFHKLRQVPGGFWMRTVGYCADCKENHPRGQHSRYRQSLYMRDEEAAQKALAHVLDGPSVPYKGIHQMAMEGKIGSGRTGPAPSTRPPYFSKAGGEGIPVMRERIQLPSSGLMGR